MELLRFHIVILQFIACAFCADPLGKDIYFLI